MGHGGSFWRWQARDGREGQGVAGKDDGSSSSGYPCGPPPPHGSALSGRIRGGHIRARLLLGAERKFWEVPGVLTTAVGYSGGYTPNPTYEEVCTGRTGHAEVVLVVFDKALTSYDEMLRIFWESHDPTQGMRQGNDAGTQYRSAIFVASDDQLSAAKLSRDRFQAALISAGHGEITTEIAEAGPFYYAEDYHQQYLAKNPTGYCGLGGTGVACPVGLTTAEG